MSPLFVAKGTKFLQTLYSLMHQASAYGPDAEEFRPERWADPKLRPGWNYIPFGGEYIFKAMSSCCAHRLAQVGLGCVLGSSTR